MRSLYPIPQALLSVNISIYRKFQIVTLFSHAMRKILLSCAYKMYAKHELLASQCIIFPIWDLYVACVLHDEISRLGIRTPISTKWFPLPPPPPPHPTCQSITCGLGERPINPQADKHHLFLDCDWQDRAIRDQFIRCCTWVYDLRSPVWAG